MSDKMTPLHSTALFRWILEEYKERKSIFGIPKSNFYFPEKPSGLTILGRPCGTPLGPAAGPHTQLAQNIVSAYLCGGSYIELKTVQILDELAIEKPCIDARDEAYNTEWSSEFTVPRAYEEYAKAYFLLALVDALLAEEGRADVPFLFNMSIGYDLKGIKSPKIDRFIENLKDSSQVPEFNKIRASLDSVVTEEQTLSAEVKGKLRGVLQNISPAVAESVTLSTMHGAPPEEIESICTYLLTEKNLDTFVKLNPTLLGYDTVSRILSSLGYDYISLSRETFEKDLQMNKALEMLSRLMRLAEKQGRRFGVKLSNTLAVRNTDETLPGDEKYMSGRALFPLTVLLASRLSRQFHGSLHMSFAGGAYRDNIPELLGLGIQPVTLATDLLKPGGYARLKDCAEAAGPFSGYPEKVDTMGLEKLAEGAAGMPEYSKERRGWDKAEIPEPLPLFDCYAAPCSAACPVGQDVPGYIHLLSQGKYEEALKLIYRDNPLPHITGYICDHQCMYHCTRLDYEGAVEIREMKKIAAEKGYSGSDVSVSSSVPAGDSEDLKTAVVGAGPAGLAAAFFLAREGVPVTVFEKENDAGGVVSNALPSFRLPREVIEKDVAVVKSLGADFRFNTPESFSVAELREQGFRFIVIAVGAGREKALTLPGEGRNVLQALEMLWQFKKEGPAMNLGKHVCVIGGGNTAMDSARAAAMVPGVKEVSIIYRRTRNEMPADREEFENALDDGVLFRPLLAPKGFADNGDLTLEKMRLGEKDSSGRPKPVGTGEELVLPADTVITALGETMDAELISRAGLPVDDRGRISVNSDTCETEVPGVYLCGDVHLGPSTVIRSASEGRKAAFHILGKEPETAASERPSADEILSRRGQLKKPAPADNREALIASESFRCLQCDILCEKCVEVCPNRANVAVPVPGGKNIRQIVHLDPLCNECGNCSSFCPFEGDPYKDKLTFYGDEESFAGSPGDGFFFRRAEGGIEAVCRINGETAVASDGSQSFAHAVVREFQRRYPFFVEGLR